MGIPVPSKLTPAETDACDRFSQAIWGKPLFDREPSHNGRHGLGCEYCLPVLVAQERVEPAPQPWELRAVA